MKTDTLEWMIQNQIVRRGVHDVALLNALRKIDRKDFVPAAHQSAAYEDNPLPLANGQTISQPYIVALMTENLKLAPHHHVLEIGTGSGYQTAILAILSHSVVSIERIPALYETAMKSLPAYKFPNITLIRGDGKEGWEKKAPYDRIILTAAPSDFPTPIFDQLAEGGIMVAPMGRSGHQTLSRIKKTSGKPEIEKICAVRFVPLI